MAETERLTIVLPAKLAHAVKTAIGEGRHYSASSVIQEAMREWQERRQVGGPQLADVHADIDRRLTEIASRRVTPLEPDTSVTAPRHRFFNHSGYFA